LPREITVSLKWAAQTQAVLAVISPPWASRLGRATLAACGDYGPPMGDVIRGLRQALVMLLLSSVVALVVAGLWFALQGGEFRPKVAITLLVIAGLISLTGGTALSRAVTNDARAFLGMGPDLEAPDTGDGLTGLGVFLFVSVPLFIAGGALFGSR
jgi:hypothetical protein